MKKANGSILFWGSDILQSKSLHNAISKAGYAQEILYRSKDFDIQTSLLSRSDLVVLEIDPAFNPVQTLMATWPGVPCIVMAAADHHELLADVVQNSEFEVVVSHSGSDFLVLLARMIGRIITRKRPRFSIPKEQISAQSLQGTEAGGNQAETDFKKLYSLLRTMTDTVPDMIWAKDLDGKYIYTNTSTCRNLLNSHNTHEPIGRDIMEFVERERLAHPEDAEWFSFGENCIKTDRETLITGRMCRFKESGTILGTTIILDIYKAPLLDDSGKVIGTVGTARDITLHEETKERYRKLFDNSPDPVVLHVDGIVIAANQAAVNFVGAENVEDQLGKRVFDFVHADYRDKSQAWLANRSLGDGGSEPTEQKYLTLEGKVRDVIAVSVPIKYGNQEAWMVTFRDVTEEKLIQEQIQQSLREKEALLQEIYHRTKNNMQVVSSIINIRSRDVEDHSSIQMFKEIRDRISAMSLAHDQLYTAQDLTAIDFKPYLQNLSNHLSQSYSGISSRAPIHIDSESLVISIDQAVPLGLVINEILTNAYKYAFPADRSGNIHLQLRHRNESELEIIIKDDGIGLPIDLFNDSLSTVIISGLVTDQLGGSVDYDGENGTRFQIRIPNKEIIRRI